MNTEKDFPKLLNQYENSIIKYDNPSKAINVEDLDFLSKEMRNLGHKAAETIVKSSSKDDQLNQWNQIYDFVNVKNEKFRTSIVEEIALGAMEVITNQQDRENLLSGISGYSRIKPKQKKGIRYNT